jgi:hypothetical protein
VVADGFLEFCHHGNAVARRNDPARLRAGLVVIPPMEPVQMVVDGRIRWDVGQDKNNTWQMFFHSLQWLEKLIEAHEADITNENLKTAAWYASSWVETHPLLPRNEGPWHDHATSMRASTLACLRSQGLDDKWLVEALRTHGDVLRDEQRYAGPYNHGINQDLSLIMVGSVLGEDEWIDFAAGRLERVARTSISENGVLDEQAPEYSNYLWALWSRALEYLGRTGRPEPAEIRERLARMPEFMAHATLPDGRYVPFGDSHRNRPLQISGTPAEFAATRGKAGRRPDSLVRVYPEGYAFARSGWGEHRPFVKESYYALRFGPARYRHGHYDHMSFVYAADGRIVVTDSGHRNYQRDGYRDHLVSAAAHNVVEVVGLQVDAGHQTTLVSAERRGAVHSFELSGAPYRGIRLFRQLTFMLDWNVIVVHDVALGDEPHRYRQLIHLDPALALRRVGLGEVWGAWGEDGGADIRIAELLNLGSAQPVEIVRGATDPMLGWVSYNAVQRDPAGVVVYEAAGHRVEFLTVICCRKDLRAALIGGRQPRIRIQSQRGRRFVKVQRSLDSRPRMTRRGT